MPSLLLDYWAQLVRNFKDSEKAYDKTPRESELLALAIVDWIQQTPIRQWNLFSQQRGEDFDRLMATLEEAGKDRDAIRRYLETEDLWKATLELGER